MAIALSVITFVFVLAAVLFYIGSRNEKLAAKIADLEQRKTAAKMLKDAITYLEPWGSGENLEFTNARAIMELAMYRVLYENN